MPQPITRDQVISGLLAFFANEVDRLVEEINVLVDCGYTLDEVTIYYAGIRATDIHIVPKSMLARSKA